MLLWFFHRKRIKLSRFCCVRISLKSAPDILYTSASSLYSSYPHRIIITIIPSSQSYHHLHSFILSSSTFQHQCLNLTFLGFPQDKYTDRDSPSHLSSLRSAIPVSVTITIIMITITITIIMITIPMIMITSVTIFVFFIQYLTCFWTVLKTVQGRYLL